MFVELLLSSSGVSQGDGCNLVQWFTGMLFEHKDPVELCLHDPPFSGRRPPQLGPGAAAASGPVDAAARPRPEGAGGGDALRRR